jgi:glutathione S-transferase
MLNTELTTKPYLGGFSPSARDATTFSTINAQYGFDEEIPVNIKRWLKNISSFSSEVRSSWK